MNAVQISGMSGAGKTMIAAVLARRGLAVIDADGDPLLARHVDSAGNVVGDPAVPDFAWLARHSWAWNPARLDELIGAAAPATLYVCGCADNELELADRFTQVFLLEIDEPTMLGRLASREKNGAVSGTHASTSAASCRNIRAACMHPGRFPSTPGGLWTKWWTRYFLTRWVAQPRAEPRAEPESRAISPAGAPDPRTVKRFLPQGHHRCGSQSCGLDAA
jgi:hypothetical protein